LLLTVDFRVLINIACCCSSIGTSSHASDNFVCFSLVSDDCADWMPKRSLVGENAWEHVSYLLPLLRIVCPLRTVFPTFVSFVAMFY